MEITLYSLLGTLEAAWIRHLKITRQRQGELSSFQSFANSTCIFCTFLAVHTYTRAITCLKSSIRLLFMVWIYLKNANLIVTVATIQRKAALTPSSCSCNAVFWLVRRCFCFYQKSKQNTMWWSIQLSMAVSKTRFTAHMRVRRHPRVLWWSHFVLIFCPYMKS